MIYITIFYRLFGFLFLVWMIRNGWYDEKQPWPGKNGSCWVRQDVTELGIPPKQSSSSSFKH